MIQPPKNYHVKLLYMTDFYRVLKMKDTTDEQHTNTKMKEQFISDKLYNVNLYVHCVNTQYLSDILLVKKSFF